MRCLKRYVVREFLPLTHEALEPASPQKSPMRLGIYRSFSLITAARLWFSRWFLNLSKGSSLALELVSPSVRMLWGG